ncbi:MAG: methyltransferase domain-containing protein, partial [Chloroflexota bacterium]
NANSPEFWEHVYQEMDAPWDLGRPTPVFQQLVDEKRFGPGKLIVLGAGKGHDARLFAQAGFAVTAVDFAETAVRHMHANNDPTAPFTPLQADIFALPAELNGTFDYVLEYTCFCAIDKTRRPEYADLVQRLLRPGGTYIALAFPIVDKIGGPPFAVQPDELIQLFTERNFSLESRMMPTNSTPHRQGIEELVVMQKR